MIKPEKPKISIDEAIETLTKHSHLVRASLNPKLRASFELGIEALKYCLADRLHHIKKEYQKLPGETEEEE